MKTLKTLIGLGLVALMSMMVACGDAAEPAAEGDAQAQEETSTTEEAEPEVAGSEAEAVELAEHVCNDGCSAESCNLVCGEKGHECTDACHAGHDHGTEGEAEGDADADASADAEATTES
ncbi:MAG: hypothetical protein HRT71_18745 [Flavobacteriales bacterium]|nr:hypothetical protein [Flavobacteriales bacterium]